MRPDVLQRRQPFPAVFHSGRDKTKAWLQPDILSFDEHVAFADGMFAMYIPLHVAKEKMKLSAGPIMASNSYFFKMKSMPCSLESFRMFSNGHCIHLDQAFVFVQ